MARMVFLNHPNHHLAAIRFDIAAVVEQVAVAVLVDIAAAAVAVEPVVALAAELDRNLVDLMPLADQRQQCQCNQS